MPIASSLHKRSPFAKCMFLLGLFLVSTSIASVLQIAIILPFSNCKSWSDLAILNNLSDPAIVVGMKIAQAVSVFFMFILPSLFFAYVTSVQKIAFLKVKHLFSGIAGIGVVFLVFTIMPFINWAGEVNSHFSLPSFLVEVENWMKQSEEVAKKLTDAFLHMNGVADLLLNMVVIALLAAVGEELFFRGCMQNIFIEWIKNKHAGVWLTAIIFSAVHMQFYGFFPRMVLGVVLGYLYVWSGSLWLPIFFHFLNNGLAVLFSYFISKGIISEGAETIGAGESSIGFAFVSAVVSAVVMYVVHKNSTPSPILPEGEYTEQT